MTLQSIVTLLRSSDAAVRRAAWGKLWELRGKLPLGQRDLADLDERARNEPEVEVMSLARSVVAALQDLDRPLLQDQLWAPFNGPRARYLGIAGGAAVVSVCDEHAVPDAKSLITLAQFLPCAREIDFLTLNLAHPAGDPFHPGGLRAICLVGRPSFYDKFVLTPCLPGDLRFRFPGNDAEWRGRPPTAESAAVYHRVEQWWAGEGTGAFEVREASGPGRGVSTRVDYAVVQRFPISFGGRQLIVVVLAGCTSLGTAGAVDFATREQFDLRQFQPSERCQQPITDETRIEVLLEVTGTIHSPSRPWTPYAQVRKVFLNGSPNLASGGPSCIRLVGGRGGADKVTAVFFDDDGVRFGAEENSALIALCLKAAQAPGHVVGLHDLLTDLSVWPGRRRPGAWAGERQVKYYYLDAFQRRSLNGRLHVHGKTALHLDTAIELT